MAFLFKNKKPATGIGPGLPPASRKLTSADGSNTPSTSTLTGTGNESPSSSRATGSPSMQRVASPTPDSARPLMGAMQYPAPRAPPTTAPPARPQPDSSLYPWSQERIDFVSGQANPFPRYGAAVNSVASREGDVYMIGGLVNGTNVKGDLWIIEAGNSPATCYPVQTTAEGPGPRVGHASLLVGNAFIVFGGDTKVEENDVLDDTLYLLNTSTKHWSRALPPGQRPSGRYGHTLNILGSKIYIFGGQVEGYFFNDLVAFDLNALQQANSKWEVLVSNNPDGPPVRGGQIPQARTNHTVVTWNDKLVLFGGTDGNKWFNDVWIYDPRTNIWSQQDCIGYIPVPREGHAAALVGDVMYVLGGRTEEGKDLGDLAAFRITTRRWYTFQNMGPAPSPRSGHGMTAYGTKIIIVGGEPSTTPREPAELSMAYILDTTKIKYPIDHPAPRSVTSRRPSVTTDRSQTPQGDRSASRQGVRPEPREAGNGRNIRTGSQESLTQYKRSLDSTTGETGATTNGAALSSNGLMNGQSPNAQSQAYSLRGTTNRPGMDGAEPVRSMSRQGEYGTRFGQDSSMKEPTSPISPIAPPSQIRSPIQQLQQGQYTPKQSFDDGPRELPGSSAVYRQAPQGSHATQGSLDSISSSLMSVPVTAPNGIARQAMQNAAQPRANQYQDTTSMMMQQRNDDLSKELESARSRNAWYASELALARKAGYRPTSSDGPPTERSGEAFAEDEKPLVEALLKMRSELAAVQEALSTQSTSAAQKIAQVQKERDAAIQEAVTARARAAARSGRSDGYRDTPTPDGDSSMEDINRRLASTLAAHNELKIRMQGLSAELDAERKARETAQESANAAHDRATELDSRKQENVSELERLRIELHESQMAAREAAANHTEAQASVDLLQIDKNELSAKLASAHENVQNHNNVLASLREAINASSEKSTLLENKLDLERQNRGALEEQLTQMRIEHDARMAELESTSARARDLQDEVAHHKEEARTHREAVLAGLGRLADGETSAVAANNERVTILQQRLDAANALMRRNQEAADRAAERLRKAEERIAGLESYQEQSSREGLGVRKQLQVASRDALALRSENAELQQQLATHKLNVTALQVQHGALKGLLSERGIDASEVLNRQTLDDGNDMNSSIGPTRLAELEAQLSASTKAHEDMRASFERREMEANRGWEDKLAALDNDYQSAVKYLKGTEKMLSKMKQELHRYKSQNRELEDELIRARNTQESSVSNTRDINAAAARTSGDWDSERSALRAEIEQMQERVTSSVQQLEAQMASVRAAQTERDNYRTASESLQRELNNNRTDVESLRNQNSKLEERAAEAERKIQLLLDTVGTSVNNYRRASQSAEGLLSGGMLGNTSGHGHNRDISFASIGSDFGGPGDAIPPPSAEAEAGSAPTISHNRSISRNSLALDTLASELENLRSHWETTTNAHRLSDRSVDLGSPLSQHQNQHSFPASAGEPGPSVITHLNTQREATSAVAPSVPAPSQIASTVENESAPPLSASMAEWRKKLDLGDDADSRHSRDASETSASVPGSASFLAQPMHLPGYTIANGQMPYSAGAQQQQEQEQELERDEQHNTLRPQISNLRGQSSNASEPSNEMDIA